MKSIIFFASAMALVATVPVVWSTLNAEEFSRTARFSAFDVLSSSQHDAEITEINYGKTAVITVDVEKLVLHELSDILVKTKLESQESNQYLVINPPTVFVGMSMSDEDYPRYDTPEYDKNPFPDGKNTGPMMIYVSVIDDPGRDFEDTVHVSLFVHGKKMDEKSFRIKVVNPIID